MHASSGFDHLKEERLRFVAATTLESALEVQDCWDGSSEDETVPTGDPAQRRSPGPSASVSDGLGISAVPGQVSAQDTTEQALSCYTHLPEHATVMAAVQEVLKQQGTVRN